MIFSLRATMLINLNLNLKLRNLTANLAAYMFGTKYDIHKRASALQTTSGLLHRLKTT